MFEGHKGGGKYTRTNDNLFSTDLVEVLLGISEGPIKGLKDGAKSFYFGDTPFVGPNGEQNLESIQVNQFLGSEVGENIRSLLGGFASSIGVNTPLAKDVPVVRAGTKTEIDYIDLRFMIQALVRSDDKGEYNHTGKLKLEYKRTAETTWRPVPTATNLSATEIPLDRSDLDPEVVVSATSPLPIEKNKVWLRPSAMTSPLVANANNSGWVAPAAGTLRSFHAVRAPFTKSDVNSSTAKVNIWVNSSTGAVFFFNGLEWKPSGSSLRIKTESANLTNGVVAITGKTTQGFVQEYRIPVENILGDTYQVRVTMLEGPYTDGNRVGQFNVQFESIQEVTSKSMRFPGLATVQVAARASDQFTSMPELSGIWEGRIVRVPSNYDPVARTYSGVWNGVWKLAYTNNPAYVGYDLVMNNRYGMNAYYPVDLNKWDVYEAGQWCDERVQGGAPRFTFNGLINEPLIGREAINYIFGIFGGRFFDDGNGQAVIRIDKPTSPVAIFAPENVEQGLFVYTPSALSTQYNDITVTFINPDLNWQQDRRRVFDQNHINKFGRITKNITAVGCTNAAEAIRRGRYQLVTSLTETLSVSFKTNRIANNILPYDIILIADEALGFGWSGRIKSYDAASRKIRFRDPIFLEAGVTYDVTITVPNAAVGYESFVARPAAGQSGLLTEITLNTALPSQIAADMVFSVSQVGTKSAPKPFRVISITPEGDEMVSVQAVEVNRLKWDFIDGIVNTLPVDVTGDELSSTPQPVRQVTAEGRLVKGKQQVTVRWGLSPSPGITHYLLSYSRNGDAFIDMGMVKARSFVFDDLPAGEYLFSVAPVNLAGLVGASRFASFDSKGTDTGLLPLLEEVVLNPVTALNPDGSFVAYITGSWKVVPNATYEILYRPVGATTSKRITSNVANFRTDLVAGATDYVVTITALIGNSEVRQPYTANLLVPGDNTIPAAPTDWTGVGGLNMITLSGPSSTESDFKEFRIENSTSAGGPWRTIAAISGTSFVRQVKYSDTDFYYRVRQVDRSGNISPPSAVIQVRPFQTFIDDEAPGTPTGLTLTSVVGKLTATWNANPEPDLQYYDIQIREGATGNYVGFQTASNRYTWDVQPNTIFTVQVRAVDRSGNRSNWTTEVVHTSARDNVPPATPTGLKLISGFNTIWVEFNHNTEPDLSHYEIAASPATFTVAAAEANIVHRGPSNKLALTEIPDSGTRFVRVRAVDTSGNASGWTAILSRAATPPPTISNAQLTGMIDATSFAQGIEPVSIITSGGLPTSKTTTAIVWNGQLYRWDGSRYTASVAAGDVTGKFVASQIGVGAVQTEQLAAGAVTTSKMGIGDFRNLIPDGLITDAAAWTHYATAAITTDITSASLSQKPRRSIGAFIFDGSAATTYIRTHSQWFGVSAGDEILFSAEAYPIGAATGTVSWQAQWRRADGTTGSSPALYSRSHAGSAEVQENSYVVPAGVTQIRVYGTLDAAGTGKWVLASPYLMVKNKGELIVDGALKARHVHATEEFITTSAQIKNAIITNAHIVELSAAKLMAGTALAASVTVSGTALSTIRSQAATGAQDPAVRINSGSTRINPGQIIISGGTTLADWRKGGDETRIDGGNLSANTVATNALTVGNRNLTLTGIQFEHNRPATNQVWWSAGQIRYINNAGANATASIVTGTATWTSGVLYIYWVQGEAQLRATTVQATAFHENAVVLATYQGGTRLDADYGRTVIDQDGIKTDAIVARHLVKTSALITATAQLANAIVGTAKIGDLAVNTIKIANNSVVQYVQARTTGNIAIAEGSAWTTVQSLTFSSTANRPSIIGANANMVSVNWRTGSSSRRTEFRVLKGSTRVGESSGGDGILVFEDSSGSATYHLQVRFSELVIEGGGSSGGEYASYTAYPSGVVNNRIIGAFNAVK